MKTIAFYILLIISVTLLSSCVRRVPVGGYYPYGQGPAMSYPYGRGYYNPYGYRNYGYHGGYNNRRDNYRVAPNYGHHAPRPR